MAELNEKQKEKLRKQEELNRKWWANRAAKAQEELTTRNIKETEKQLVKYYQTAMDSVISSFEATLDKLYANIEAGKQLTPADLYNLDKYWQLQGQLNRELQKLGDKEVALLTKRFTQQYMDIYKELSYTSASFFNAIDNKVAQQMINAIWCADGKTWSQRIWTNTDKLRETLNDGLIRCVVGGQTSSELKKELIKEFNVAYNRADSIVRTEMAHIQTQAAQKRYQDYGIEWMEVWVDEDEKTCPICAKHEGERVNVNAHMPIPFHPRCRCCMIPVVD